MHPHSITLAGVGTLALSFFSAVPEILRLVLLALMVTVHLRELASRKRSAAARRHRRASAAKVVLAAAGLAALCNTGCSTTNLADVVKAASQDTNSVQVHFSSPWGSMDYKRN